MQFNHYKGSYFINTHEIEYSSQTMLNMIYFAMLIVVIGMAQADPSKLPTTISPSSLEHDESMSATTLTKKLRRLKTTSTRIIGFDLVGVAAQTGLEWLYITTPYMNVQKEQYE